MLSEKRKNAEPNLEDAYIFHLASVEKRYQQLQAIGLQLRNVGMQDRDHELWPDAEQIVMTESQ